MARRTGLMVKLVTLLIVLTVIPTCIISYVAVDRVNELGDYATDSNQQLGENATLDSIEALQSLGEQMIEQKARDCAKQVEIYLADRPGMTVSNIMTDADLHDISVQSVGETGYTAIVDANHFVILTHIHPSYVGMDLALLEDSLPSFWAVIEPSAGGNLSQGYYDWEEPDGSIRQKYAYISPINVTTADGEDGLTLWATTYIDEFSAPITTIQDEIVNATLETNDFIDEEKAQLTGGFVIVIALMIMVVLICSILFSRSITRPVYSLKATTESINEGNLDVPVEVHSSDEIGDLALSFDAMRLSLKSSYENLEQKVVDRTLQIQESERRLADIISFLPDPTFVIDSEGKVIAWNRAIEEMTRVKAKDMLGKGEHEYAVPFYGEKRPIVVDLAMMPDKEVELKYNSVQRQGDALVAETFAPNLGDGGRYVSAAASALRDSKGQIIGAIEIIRDVTERNMLEGALKKEKEVAEDATRAKSEFLANMSHEIRTPMNGIIGMIDLTLDTELSQEQHEYLEMAKGSAKSLLTLINDILDFSKIEAKKMDFEVVDFDVYDTMDKTMHMLGIDADEKSIELVYEIDPQIDYHIKGDPMRLKQVITNLVKNAIKFTEKGHVLVKVYEEESGGEEKRLHFSVEDTGIGIPSDKLGTIFESFAQVDGSRSRRYGGTGLGLTITRRLVEMMKGEIWVESEEGRGSTFHLIIPYELGEKMEQLPVQPEDLKEMRALIVDDNAINRLILRRTMEAWGMRVDEATCGNECCKMMAATQGTDDEYQLMLLDCMMPDLDGFEVVEKLKVKGITDIVIIMLSSLDQQGLKERSKEVGINEYLVKPVSQSALLNSTMNVLSRKRDRKKRTVKTNEEKDTIHISPDTRILLAEDNVVNRKLAVRLLEKVGLSPVTAENGIEVLKALEGGRFDIVLMDIQMPEMDGIETTRKIREMEKGSDDHLPIIALTAHAMKGDRERFLAEGMDDYISKPLNARELYSLISKYVNRGE